jgi:hypothetical protein
MMTQSRAILMTITRGIIGRLPVLVSTSYQTRLAMSFHAHVEDGTPFSGAAPQHQGEMQVSVCRIGVLLVRIGSVVSISGEHGISGEH